MDVNLNLGVKEISFVNLKVWSLESIISLFESDLIAGMIGLHQIIIFFIVLNRLGSFQFRILIFLLICVFESTKISNKHILILLKSTMLIDLNTLFILLLKKSSPINSYFYHIDIGLF